MNIWFSNCGWPMNSGRADRNAASTPETCAADIDVPLSPRYRANAPLLFGVNTGTEATMAPVAAEVILSPAPPGRGFLRPSSVGPFEESNVMP
jgi:hypothetical protein